MLGWQILSHGEYRLDLPVLSKEEEGIILKVQDRFRETARSRTTQGNATEIIGKEDCAKIMEELLAQAAKAEGLYLDRRQQEYLCEAAFNHIYGFAFIGPLIEDPGIEEISIIGPLKPVYVYVRKQGWKSVNACFDDERAICDMINRMSSRLGRRITMQNPRLDAMLPDGSRLHASLPPISNGEITIRKFREHPFSPRELVENSTIDADAMAFLSIIMQCDMSILIAGNTASGKTTTLNALFSFVPWNERVVITEETPEINVPHRHQMRLVANKDMEISLKDLVYDSLRMRPDRMIVGEVRNKEETEALFDVLLAGQARGSYATFHAQSANEALVRLRTFGISDNDMQSIDCIIVQRRMLEYDPRKRRIAETRRVVEVMEVKDRKTIYAHGMHERQRTDQDQDACPIPSSSLSSSFSSSALLDVAAQSFGMSRKEMTVELGKRKKLVARMATEYAGFYAEIQQQLYGASGFMPAAIAEAPEREGWQERRRQR